MEEMIKALLTSIVTCAGWITAFVINEKWYRSMQQMNNDWLNRLDDMADNFFIALEKCLPKLEDE